MEKNLVEIDFAKLKRNYIKEPLKITKNGVGSEKPYKEDLNYLYIDLNISIKDLHNIVEFTLEQINKDVAKSYKDYRNYK